MDSSRTREKGNSYLISVRQGRLQIHLFRENTIDDIARQLPMETICLGFPMERTPMVLLQCNCYKTIMCLMQLIKILKKKLIERTRPQRELDNSNDSPFPKSKIALAADVTTQVILYGQY